MKVKPRILLAVGGTGGHIFPSLALAEAFKFELGCDILFAGGGLSCNPFFDKERFAFQEVSCGRKLSHSFRMIQGLYQSLQLIRSYNPDVVLGFGSYYTIPLISAAKLLGKKIHLHEANSIPGRVNRFFSTYADVTWVHFPETAALLKGNVEVGGMPLRSHFRSGLISKQEARQRFGLEPDIPTLLVFGGSQGAERVNTLFSEAAIFYLKAKLPPFQVIHLTGSLASAAKLAIMYRSANILAYVEPFEKRMDLAWAACDFSVTRAGAASIAEQKEFKVPGIVIPYPFSTDHHQDKNAECLEKEGLGIMLIERDLTPQILADKIEEGFLKREALYKVFKAHKGEFPQQPLAVKIFNRM